MKSVGKPGEKGKNTTIKLSNTAMKPAIVSLAFLCSDPKGAERKEA